MKKQVSQSEETPPVIQTASKKAYRKPVLIRLGSLREMTLSVSNKGGTDGGRTGNKRFTGRGARSLFRRLSRPAYGSQACRRQF